MLYSLNGKLIYADVNTAVVECGGVGFKCSVTLSTRSSLPEIGKNVTLFTHLAVREDAMELYGFYGEEELDCFRLLIGVSGIGPKAALAILSELSPSKLKLCIASGDAKTITRAQGIGNKTAQRVVLELKDKIGSIVGSDDSNGDMAAVGVVSASGNAADAVSALVSLGYPQSEASLVVGRLDSTLPTEELIKQALTKFMR